LNTNVMNVVIAEDDPRQLQMLTDTLSQTPFIQVVGSAANGDDLIKLVTEKREVIDALILDKDLSGNTGTGKDGLHSYTLLYFRGIQKPAIMVSGEIMESAQMYDLGIIDVVSKPYTPERINKALNKLYQHVRYKSFMEDGGMYVPIFDEEIVQVLPSEILFIETDKEPKSKKNIVHTTRGIYTTKISLKAYENYLANHHFFYITRSCLANFKKITGFDESEVGIGEHKMPLTEDKTKVLELKTIWMTIKKS